VKIKFTKPLNLTIMKSKVIFITGGTSGIGKALVEQLHQENSVIVCGRNQQRLDECKALYPEVEFIQADISKRTDMKSVQAYINRKYGKLDVLINNAGIGTHIDFNETGQEVDFRDMDVNFRGTVETTSLLLPLLKESNSNPTVVVVSSILAKVPIYNIPIYSASKAALHSYAISLRQQLNNIQVVEVLPPIVDTPMTEDVKNNGKMSPEAVASTIISGIEKGKKEVYPGMSKVANFMTKVASNRIEALMNAA